MRRQRFYPQQWRRAVQPLVDQLLVAHGQGMHWVGWERSLPRLVLSADRLSRTVLDLLKLTLSQTEHSRGLDGMMSLRVTWQTGLIQELALTLEHRQLELSDEALATLNAATIPSHAAVKDSFPREMLLRLRDSVQQLGGELTCSRCNGGGTLFRLSLPVDDKMTLVRRWLDHATAMRAAQVGGTRGLATRSAFQIRMFIVGRKTIESHSALDAADARLQSLAGAQDIFYRAARSRWIWVTTSSSLPKELQRDGWQSQLVNHWHCPLTSAPCNERESVVRQNIARAVVTAMDAALGNRVPPVDNLDAKLASVSRLRIDRPMHRGAHNSSHAAATATTRSAPLTQHRASPGRDNGTSSIIAPPMLTRQRRWRYPI